MLKNQSGRSMSVLAKVGNDMDLAFAKRPKILFYCRSEAHDADPASYNMVSETIKACQFTRADGFCYDGGTGYGKRTQVLIVMAEQLTNPDYRSTTPWPKSWMHMLTYSEVWVYEDLVSTIRILRSRRGKEEHVYACDVDIDAPETVGWYSGAVKDTCKAIWKEIGK